MKSIVLDTTTKKLQMVMSGAAATTNPTYTVSYADVTTTFTEGNLNGALNGTTPVDIVPAPAASTRRTVTEIVLYNADTAPVTVTFQIDDNGTDRIIKSIYLAAGETWEMSTQTAIDGAPGADGASSDYLSVLVNTEVSITGATTANWGKQHVVTGSTNYTITLQACSGHTGEFMSFRILNTGITTLDGNSSETIDGVTTRAYYQGQIITLYCDGSNAYVLQSNNQGRSAFVPAEQFICSVAKTFTLSTSQRFCYYVAQTSAADGQTFDVPLFMNKGTYTLSAFGATSAVSPKLDWTLDGVSQTTGQDWYSGGNVFNVEKTFTLTVTYTGWHVLRVTVNGKNASSGGYQWFHTAVWAVPSAY